MSILNPSSSAVCEEPAKTARQSAPAGSTPAAAAAASTQASRIDDELSLEERRIVGPPVVPMLTGVGIILVPPGLSGIWMSQRLDTGDYRGYWQVPGGKVEEHETHDAAAVRELRQETGIHALRTLLNRSYDSVHEKPTGERYRSVQFSYITSETPRNMEPDKSTPWELVQWWRIPTLQTFGAIREMFWVDPLRLPRFGDKIAIDALTAHAAKFPGDPLNMIRTAGEALCSKCHQPHRSHPAHPVWTYLNILCDGSFVKL